MMETDFDQLREQLYELRRARLEYIADTENYTVEELMEMEPEELYEIDDGDNLIQGIDIILDALPLN